MTKVREEGYKDTDIISMSEEYFQLADKMVDDAENCSQRYDTQNKQIEKALKRQDLLSINHRSSEFFASYFDLLFALNEQTHPGEKRMLAYAKTNCPL